MATVTKQFYSTDKTGLLEDLATTNKTTLVGAINEVKNSAVRTSSADTLALSLLSSAEKIRVSRLEPDGMGGYVDNPSREFYSTNKTGLVENLTTTNKTSLVDAINEINSKSSSGSGGSGSVDSEALSAIEESIANQFSTTKTYINGNIVLYNHSLYRFKAIKTAGAWDASAVEKISINDIIGDMTTLRTTTKTKLVNAINEVDVNRYNLETVNDYSKFTSEWLEGTPGPHLRLYKFGRMIFIIYRSPEMKHSNEETLFVIPEEYRPVSGVNAPFVLNNSGYGIASITPDDGVCSVKYISNTSATAMLHFTTFYCLDDNRIEP